MSFWMVKMPDDHHDVRALFDRTIDLTASERKQLLSEVAAMDPGLATKVSELLAASDSTRTPEPFIKVDVDRAFQELPDATRALHDGERIQTPLGNGTVVRLLSQTGRIGNTEVYEVDLPAQGRSVALKLLRTEVMTRDMRWRFRTEAQLLACLDHNGITTLLTAGVCRTSRGVEHASIVTSMVNGETLDVWADTASPSSIARMVARIARAIHFAHLRGILHRDIKPGNIMITREGEPRVLDLGVAKLIDPMGAGSVGSLVSEGSSVVGTLRYMAPEQFTPTLRRVDLQADVYALGVVLYELLAGRAPIDVDGLSTAEASDLKRFARPTVPRVPGVRHDLLMCAVLACAADPVDRYESCAAFADDIDRVLAGRPLHKRAPSLAQRALLFVRRRPMFSAMTTLAIASTITAGAIYAMQQHQVRLQRDRAEIQFDQTRKFARWVIFQLDRELATIPKSADVRRLMITEAGYTLEALGNDPAADDGLRLEIANAHVRLAGVSGTDLGDDRNAEQQYTAALEVISGLDDQTTPDARLLTVWSAAHRARTNPEGHKNDPQLAHDLFLELALLENDLGHDARYWRMRSQASWYWSRRLFDQRADPATIIPVIRASVAYADRAHQLDPTDPANQGEQVQSRFYQAMGEMDLNLPTAMDAAIDAETHARQSHKRNHPLGLHHVARTTLLRGMLLAKLGRIDEAVAAMCDAIATADNAVAADPSNKQPFRVAEVSRIQLAQLCLETTARGDARFLPLGLEAANDAIALLNERDARGWLDPIGEGHYPSEYAEIERQLREGAAWQE